MRRSRIRPARLAVGAVVIGAIALTSTAAFAGIVPPPPTLPPLPPAVAPLQAIAAPIADQTTGKACGMLEAEMGIAGLAIPLIVPMILGSFPVTVPDIPGVDFVTEGSAAGLLAETLVADGCSTIPVPTEKVICPVDAQVAGVLPASIPQADQIPNFMNLIYPGAFIKYPRPLVPTTVGAFIATLDALGTQVGMPGAGQPLADALSCETIANVSGNEGGVVGPGPVVIPPAPGGGFNPPELSVLGTDLGAFGDIAGTGTLGAAPYAQPATTRPATISEVKKIVHKGLSLARRMFIVLGILLISLAVGGAMAITPEVAAARARITR